MDGVLTAADAANLARQYVGWSASVVVGAGVPSEIVSNHVGGQAPPYKAVPYDAAFMPEELGYPGWSF